MSTVAAIGLLAASILVFNLVGVTLLLVFELRALRELARTPRRGRTYRVVTCGTRSYRVYDDNGEMVDHGPAR